MKRNLPSRNDYAVRYAETRDPVLREKALEQYTGVIHAKLRCYTGLSADDRQDLYQEGRLAILKALQEFDPSRGVNFLTKVTHDVDGALRHYVRDRISVIRVPCWVQGFNVRADLKAAAFQSKHKRLPLEHELAKEMGVTVGRLREVRLQYAVPTRTYSTARKDGTGEDVNLDVVIAETLRARHDGSPASTHESTEEALLFALHVKRQGLQVFRKMFGLGLLESKELMSELDEIAPAYA